MLFYGKFWQSVVWYVRFSYSMVRYGIVYFVIQRENLKLLLASLFGPYDKFELFTSLWLENRVTGTLRVQIAEDRSYLCTFGPKVGRYHLLCLEP